MPGFDPDCEFCALLRDDGAQTVYEDEHTAAFFPLHPAADGHTLVVPRGHVPDLFALDLAVAQRLTRTTLRVAAALRAALAPEGMNVINSAGAAASQTVRHLHVHLVPRWTGDRMGTIWPDPAPPAPGDEAAQRERRELVRARLAD